MCGIFAVINDHQQQAAKTTLEGLKQLEYRGYDSWGIVVKPVKSSTLKVEKMIGKIGEAKTSLPSSTLALGHTRWATHGGVTNSNAHPHLDCTKTISVVHNGIVENYQQLKENLQKAKHKFLSETDSEVIAHLIEDETKQTDFLTAVFLSFKKIIGSNAIVALNAQTNTLVACRNGSPLIVGLGKNEYFLASDVTALLPHTNQIIVLQDGQAAEVSATGVKIFDYQTHKKIKHQIEVVDWTQESAQKGNFPHYLIKEIHEQPGLIKKTTQLNEESFEQLKKLASKFDQVMLVGCGTAYHISLLASYYFAEVGIKAMAFQAHEFETFIKYVNKKTLVLAVSQSGETADTLLASKAAIKAGATLGSVLNVRGSTLERISNLTFLVGAGPEISVVSSKASTAQLATLYLITKAMVGKFNQAQQELINVGKKLEKWLSPDINKLVKKTAKKMLDREHLYLVGKGTNYPAALEVSLKIKETSYLHAEAFAAGELKHGVIALIEKGTFCIVLINDGLDKQEVLSSAAQLKARGASIVGMASFEDESFDIHLPIPNLGN